MLYSTLVSNFPIMDLKKEKRNSYVALLYIIAFKLMKHSVVLPVCFEDILQDQQLKIKSDDSTSSDINICTKLLDCNTEMKNNLP